MEYCSANGAGSTIRQLLKQIAVALGFADNLRLWFEISFLLAEVLSPTQCQSCMWDPYDVMSELTGHAELALRVLGTIHLQG